MAKALTVRCLKQGDVSQVLGMIILESGKSMRSLLKGINLFIINSRMIRVNLCKIDEQ